MNYPNFENLMQVVAKLREPDTGCPWDLAQTHESLLKYLIEESYEYVHAVEDADKKKMEEEIGDVLFQVLLHTKIASEKKHFDLESVSKVLADKMIRRHPHVFEDSSLASNPEEVIANWQKIKAKEKKHKYHIRIDDAYAPALSAAHKIGEKSHAINFDWDNIQDVFKKVEEEVQEVKDELESMASKEMIFEEIGDLLFSIAQLARHLDMDAEEALKQANLKFVKRINLVEDKVRAKGSEMKDLPTNQLEAVWQEVKKQLKNN